MPTTAEGAAVGPLTLVVATRRSVVGKRSFGSTAFGLPFLTDDTCLLGVLVGHGRMVGTGCDTPVMRQNVAPTTTGMLLANGPLAESQGFYRCRTGTASGTTGRPPTGLRDFEPLDSSVRLG